MTQTPQTSDRHYFTDRAIAQYQAGQLTIPQLTKRLATILNNHPCDCLACTPG